MKVVCIDDTHKPEEVRSTNWIKKGVEYTVAKLMKNKLTGVQYYQLEEVKPDAPYGGYRVNRFAIPVEEIEKFFEMFEVGEKSQEELLELLKEKGILEEELVYDSLQDGVVKVEKWIHNLQ
jgi:hypothetical protein